MKNTLFLIITILLTTITACKDASIPQDLEGKRKYLAEKKTELRALQQEVDMIAAEINELDPPKEKAAVGVISTIIKPQDFKRYIEVEGNVMAEDIANVSSDVGGRIIKLNVKEGQYVQKGALIAVTDSETMDQQVNEIETSLSLAQTVYERQARLWEQNIGSEIQLLQAKNRVESLQQSMNTLKTQIKKKNLYAPISGVVDMEFLSQGEIAAPGMPVVSILNTSKLKIVADLQESLLGSVKSGDKVEVYFPALDMTVNERITMIGRSIDPANRTFKIEINTSSLKGKLKPNLLSIVKINDYSQKESIVIPLEVIKEEVSGQKYVYKVINKDSKKLAVKSPVVLGESSINSVIIESGLSANDEIIVKGLSSLSDNTLVNPTQETPAGNE